MLCPINLVGSGPTHDIPRAARSDAEKTALCSIYGLWINSVFALITEDALISFEAEKERPVNPMCVTLADGAFPNWMCS